MQDGQISYDDLVALAKAKPHRFFSIADISRLFNFTQSEIGMLVKEGAPAVGGKINPNQLLEWLRVRSAIKGR